MPMSIKSLRTEHLARELAAKTGESLTRAIEKALEERLQRIQRGQRSGRLMNQLEEILHRVDKLPTLDSRSPDEIVGYDEHGLPR
jgi:antitoxin VapB